MRTSEVLEFEDIKFIYDKNKGISPNGEGIIQAFIHDHPRPVKQAISLLYSDIQNVIPGVDFSIQFKRDSDSKYTVKVYYFEFVDLLTKQFISKQIDKHIEISTNEI
jgi:hypothetical protein